MVNIKQSEMEFGQLAEKWARTEREFIYASELPAQISSEFYRLGWKHGRVEVLKELEEMIGKLESLALSSLSSFSNASDLVSKEINYKLTQLDDLLKSNR